MRSEFDLIELLKKKIPRNLQGPMGIGDDAGEVPSRRGSAKWLFSTDTVVDGVDFRLPGVPAALAGRKALAVNLSDMAAMGADPAAFVASLGILASCRESWLLKFYDGMVALAKRYGVSFLGGDISRSRVFFCSIAILGTAAGRRPILRKGARPGDWIAVTGRLGGSILGRHLKFRPRIEEGRFLSRRFPPTSMIDVSDGLAQDLGHLLRASDAGARVDLSKIPVSAAAFRLSRGSGDKALRRALTDGEDFELLFTVPPGRRRSLASAWKSKFPAVPLSWIGRIVRRPAKILWESGGKAVPGFHLKRTGFRHF